MEQIIAGIEWFNNQVLWGIPMILIILLSGIYLSIILRFLQIKKLHFVFKSTIFSSFSRKNDAKGKTSITPFQAFATSLSGVIGTGNIVGVATAIILGGPGAIFWMWITAVFGSMIKFSEILLTCYYKKKTKDGKYIGGPMYYILYGLRNKPLAIIYAFFLIISSTFAGMVQADTIGKTIYFATNRAIPCTLTIVVVVILMCLVYFGGMKRLANFSSLIVPFMTIFFALISLILIGLNINLLPNAVASIFSCAFNGQSLLGGVAGYGILKAMRYGFARGSFSNDAGLGMSAIPHAYSNTKEPVEESLWGVFETFIDTIVVCTLTGLLILTSGIKINQNMSGAELAINAFTNRLGVFGLVSYCIILPIFAFTTSLTDGFYGITCLDFIFKRKNKIIHAIFYFFFFGLMILIGLVDDLNIASFPTDFVWALQDMANGLLIIPNLIGILGMSIRVRKVTLNYFGRQNGLPLKEDLTGFNKYHIIKDKN